MILRRRLAQVMNPLNWMMPLYRAIGAQYPVLSAICVCVCASVFFGGWWLLTGHEYRESLKKVPIDLSLPLAPEFHVINGSVANGEKKWIVINNPGRVGITDINVEGIRYIFKEEDWKAHKLTLWQFFQLGSLVRIPDVAAGQNSQPIELGKLSAVHLYTWDEAVRQQTGQNVPEPFRTYYCLRFTFRDERTGKKLAYYKVTQAFEAAPSFTDEGGGNAGGGVQHLAIYDAPEAIKTDARFRFGREVEEYQP